MPPGDDSEREEALATLYLLRERWTERTVGGESESPGVILRAIEDVITEYERLRPAPYAPALALQGT